MRAVLERDFLAEASRPRAFAVRAVLALLVALPVVGVLALLAGEPDMPSDTYGLFLFRAAGGAWLILLALFTPPLVVGAVLAERQNETLGLVLASPVSPLQFAAAKLLSRSGSVLLFAFAAFPCLVLPMLFGGVGGAQVLGLAMAALGIVLEMAATALWMSAAYRKFALALLVAYLLPLIRWIACMAVSAVLARFAWPAGAREAVREGAALLFASSPVGSLDGVFGTRAFLRWPVPGITPWIPFLFWGLLTAAAALVAARWHLSRESEPAAPPKTLENARVRRRFRGLPGSGNPLVWKETRLLDTAGSRGLQYRLLGILLASEILSIYTVQTFRAAAAVFSGQLALLCLVAVVQGAAALGHDRARGSWDLLRASPLRPGQMVLGKAAGVGAGLLLLAAVPATHVVLAGIAGTFTPATVGVALGLLLLVPGCWAAVGLSCGIREPTPARAMVRAAVILVVAGLGFPLLGQGVELLLYVSGVRMQEVEPFFRCGSPPVAVFETLLRWETEYAYYRRAPLAPAPLWIGGAALFALLQPFLLPWLLARRLRREAEEG